MFAKQQVIIVWWWFAIIMSILPWLLPKQWRTHDFRDNPNRIPHSTTSWFTEFCKSLCLSQFTAPFINVWAKASIAEHVDQRITKNWQEYTILHSSISTHAKYTCWCHTALLVWAMKSDDKQVLRPTQTLVQNCAQHANDPSAGSPTETLLRLLLPLSDKVYKIFHRITQQAECCCSPNYSPDHSIGRSDGRCVQRAGT